MDWPLVLYGVGAVLSWGAFLSADTEDKKMPVANVVAALLWPVTWVAIIGYAIGSESRR